MIKGAPKFIRDRYFSLRGYVQSQLLPPDAFFGLLRDCKTEADKTRLKKRSNEIIGEAALVLLIFLTNKSLVEGTKVAIDATDVFEELGLEGFSVGSVQYSGRNESVMLGQVLSERLLATLPDEVRRLIAERQRPYEIIDLYRKYIEEL